VKGEIGSSPTSRLIAVIENQFTAKVAKDAKGNRGKRTSGAAPESPEQR
jgi:hypothetical protein